MNKDISPRGEPYIDLTAKGCDSIEEGQKYRPVHEVYVSPAAAIIARIKSGLSAGKIEIVALRWEK